MSIMIPKSAPGEDPVEAVARYFARKHYANLLKAGKIAPTSFKMSDDQVERIAQKLAGRLYVDRGLDGDDVLILQDGAKEHAMCRLYDGEDVAISPLDDDEDN